MHAYASVSREKNADFQWRSSCHWKADGCRAQPPLVRAGGSPAGGGGALGGHGVLLV